MCQRCQEVRYKRAAAIVANELSILEDVSNSAEVEQAQEQENNCEDFAACANVAGAQIQVATATVANTLTAQEDTTNSAEIEQVQEQENNCEDVAVCANVGGAQYKKLQPLSLMNLVFLKMFPTVPR